jgi:hypothetical protein
MPDLPTAFVAESRAQLKQAHDKIVHCLSQLSDDQMHWRPAQGMNTLSNIVLHLCGNLRQWAVCPITGETDHRDRPREFSDRTHYDRPALLERLAAVVAEADKTMSRITTAEQLTQPKRVQGFDISVLIAIYDAVSHFKGHSQEIVYITRMLLGERYRFLFVPTTKEMGA